MTNQGLPGLAACPFCGGEAERVDIDPMQEEFANAGGSVIQCKSCGASSPVHFDRKENLEASWNTRAASAPDGVAVKELEWSFSKVAASALGKYIVDTWPGPYFTLDMPGRSYRYDRYDTLDAAKAAAQADYEQRIRSALVAAPVPAGVVAWAEFYGGKCVSALPSKTHFHQTPLYAAPQSFTSGHVAGQREMQERCVAACEGLGDEIMERAEAAHDEEDYDEYERLECSAAEYSRCASAIASLPVSAGETGPDNGGRAVIEGDAVVIRFPLDAMQTAMDGAWSLRALDTRYKITDINEFSKEFARALNHEDEQGTTEIHKMADRAFINCIENGAFGIEEHEQQDI